MPSPNDKIVIVGAGCFGLSTAYHLLKRGYTDVSILDRSSVVPAPDAASNDLNKIVRSSYSDKFYSQFCREAISMWKNKEEWGDTYHQSGVLVLGSPGEGGSYVNESYLNDLELGADLDSVSDFAGLGAMFPPHTPVATFDQKRGYLNRDGGWANASRGTSLMSLKVNDLKGKILPKKCVKALIRENGRTTGVECDDGSKYYASLVILAVGSWTPSSFLELDLGPRCLATGQCIAMLQLSDEEVEIYKECPVVIDFGTGFYIFPPNESGIVKMATHISGYTHTLGDISTPRTVQTDPEQGLLIPKSNVRDMRKHLSDIYPQLAHKPFVGTRLCWYNDSPDGNWMIGRYREDLGLMLATAGSGHAYKFLPVIGRLVADIIEGTVEPEILDKFALDRQWTHTDGSRIGKPVEINLDELCTEADLADTRVE